MIARLCFFATALVTLGCATSTNESQTRTDRCVERLLSNADASATDDPDAREYVRTTYCERFAANGWVHEDGALRIAAQHWLDRSGTCATASEGDPTRTVPCEELQRTDPILNCALLRHVRRAQVRTYLEQIDRPEGVRCDDGTPLDRLGVP